MDNSTSEKNLIEFLNYLDQINLVKKVTNRGFAFFSLENIAWPEIIINEENVNITVNDIEVLINFLRKSRFKLPLMLTHGDVDSVSFAGLQGLSVMPLTRWENMSIELTQIKADLEKDEDVIVVDPFDLEKLKFWVCIVEKVLFKGRKLSIELFKVAASMGRVVLLLGQYNNAYVSAGLLFKGQEAGVYMVSVLPDFRNLGLGKKIMYKAHHIAWNSGYKRVVLQATKDGLLLYSRLGYNSNSKVYLFNVNI